MIEAQQFHITDISNICITGIAVIERQSFQTPWSLDACTAELSITGGGGYAALYGEDKTAIGYIFFRIVLDEMHIMKIATTHSWRHQGVASTLLAKAINLARRKWLKRICLEVRASNIAAINLYNKYEFEQSGIRPGYYDNREDAVLMTKNFEEGVLTWQRQ